MIASLLMTELDIADKEIDGVINIDPTKKYMKKLLGTNEELEEKLLKIKTREKLILDQKRQKPSAEKSKSKKPYNYSKRQESYSKKPRKLSRAHQIKSRLQTKKTSRKD